MVVNITSLTRSGLSDFVIQRVSAVVIGLYTVCLIGFFVARPDVDHAGLVAFFGSTPMQLFSTLAVLSTAAHAWIGMWTIGTDYVQQHYFGRFATTFRAIYQSGTVLVLFVYVAWSLKLFWGLSP